MVELDRGLIWHSLKLERSLMTKIDVIRAVAWSIAPRGTRIPEITIPDLSAPFKTSDEFLGAVDSFEIAIIACVCNGAEEELFRRCAEFPDEPSAALFSAVHDYYIEQHTIALQYSEMFPSFKEEYWRLFDTHVEKLKALAEELEIWYDAPCFDRDWK